MTLKHIVLSLLLAAISAGAGEPIEQLTAQKLRRQAPENLAVTPAMDSSWVRLADFLYGSGEIPDYHPVIKDTSDLTAESYEIFMRNPRTRYFAGKKVSSITYHDVGGDGPSAWDYFSVVLGKWQDSGLSTQETVPVYFRHKKSISSLVFIINGEKDIRNANHIYNR